MSLLEVRNLHARVGSREILKGVNLVMEKGQVHAIMGKNGSGKSTLCQVLAGSETYTVTAGEVLYQGQNLLELKAEERAREGIFLAFQYPVEIPGVPTSYFLRAALNAIRRQRGQEELDGFDFLELIKEKMALLGIDSTFINRPVNEGFSGGEKKRNEIFQMAVINPVMALLDETDSGLDIDALKVVANGVNALRGPDRSALIVTHYQRMLNYIVPDVVHVMMDGQIVKSGSRDLALTLEEKGYEWVAHAAT